MKRLLTRTGYSYVTPAGAASLLLSANLKGAASLSRHLFSSNFHRHSNSRRCRCCSWSVYDAKNMAVAEQKSRLRRLVQDTGYPLVQSNLQRKFGPPPDWVGPPPPRGSEVFVGKIPREIFEDDLVPVFAKVGKIYEMRLMMDFSGSNRGYAFVMYSNNEEAYRAIKELNGYEIIQGRRIGVVKSVENCRLFIGRIPKNKLEEQIREELSMEVNGIVSVILYKNRYDRNMNRGFAFVEFVSHCAAATARQALRGCAKLWGRKVIVEWAEPEPDVDDELMKKVKVLFVRNILIDTSPETIKSKFEEAISPHNIEKVKKMYDYAFIHFHTRGHAELAMQKLQNMQIEGVRIEIRWAKPVKRGLSRIQKSFRGNSKYNRCNILPTVTLYKEHKNKREYEGSLKEDEGIGSAFGSLVDMSPYPYNLMIGNEILAPVRLETLCQRFLCAAPIYQYLNYLDSCSNEIWIGRVDLHLGPPLLPRPMEIGPMVTGPCCTKEQATAKAAYLALAVIQNLMKFRLDILEQPPAPTPV